MFVEPQQGASFSTLSRVAITAEVLGFDGFFVSDHYLRVGQETGLPGPTDAWTTLAGIAVQTTRMRIGSLVSSVTYRRPGILAVQVAQVDAMSGGRVELGLGTGWFAREHAAYGIPFPEKRFGMLEEQLQVITGLWTTPVGKTFSHIGEQYSLTNSPALPKPVQSTIPIILGGRGPSRTPALAARYASEFNVPFPDPKEVVGRFAVVRSACELIGREPSSLTFSIAMTVAAGATDADVARRAAAIGRDPEVMRAGALGGTAAALTDRLGQLAEAGARRVYLQLLDLDDLDHLAFLADAVLPAARSL